nr:Flp family type IVb pilin [Sphingomonas sp. Y57]
MLNCVRSMMKRLCREEKGASAVEYAILVGAIGIALSAGATNFGNGLSNKLSGMLNVITFPGDS